MFINVDINIFNNTKMKYLKNMQKGDTYIVIWLNLLVLAKGSGRNGLLYNKKLSRNYDYKLISSETGYNEDIVEKAIALFESLDMIIIDLEGIKIKNWSKYQESKGRKRIADDLTPDFKNILLLYNKCCTNLQQAKMLNPKRNKLISKALTIFTSINEIEKYFHKINHTDYLIGRNKYNWKANFDWCMSEENITKVLEGTYSNVVSDRKNIMTTSLLQDAYQDVDKFI